MHLSPRVLLLALALAPCTRVEARRHRYGSARKKQQPHEFRDDSQEAKETIFSGVATLYCAPMRAARSAWGVTRAGALRASARASAVSASAKASAVGAKTTRVGALGAGGYAGATHTQDSRSGSASGQRGPSASPAAPQPQQAPQVSVDAKERAKGLVGPVAGVATFFCAPLRAARFVWGATRVGALGAAGYVGVTHTQGSRSDSRSASGQRRPSASPPAPQMQQAPREYRDQAPEVSVDVKERAKALVGPVASVATFFCAPLRAARFVWGATRVGVLGAAGYLGVTQAQGSRSDSRSASASP